MSVVDVLGAVGTTVGSALSGGILGLVGSFGDKYLQYKMEGMKLADRAEDRKFELAKRQADLEQGKSEATARFKIAQEEGETARTVSEEQLEGVKDTNFTARYQSDGAAFLESVKAQSGRLGGNVQTTKNQGWALIAIDVCRNAIQPFTTIYLVVLTSILCFSIRRLMGAQYLNPEQVFALIQKTYDAVLFLTVTTISWWYGQRNLMKPPRLR
jgi:hypothetical protein